MDTDATQLATLIADLDHPDKPKIRAAVDALIVSAAGSDRVRSALERRLGAEGHRNYWPVAYVLGHLPQPSGNVVRSLLDALDHREPDIRWAVALLLIRMAKNDGAIVALLIELCRSGAVNQRRMALYCLRDLSLSDEQSLAALIESVSDADASVRVAATTCLKTRKDAGEAARVALLRVYLRDGELKVRNAAAVALASLGAPSEEFLGALQANRRSGDGQSKKAAEAALRILEIIRPASSGR